MGYYPINTIILTSDSSVSQDTTIHKTFPIIQQNQEKDTLLYKPIVKKIVDQQVFDSIFKQYEEREVQYQKEQLQLRTTYNAKPVDTLNILYNNLGFYKNNQEIAISIDGFQQNVLYNIPAHKQDLKAKSSEVFIFTEKNNNNQSLIQQPLGIKARDDSSTIFDWVTGFIIISVILLGWIRLFYTKYFQIIIRSAVSYQDSNALFREKNSISEKVIFLLALLFIFVVSIFSLQIARFYDIDLNNNNFLILFLIVFGSLVGLFIFRYVSANLIGNLFDKQKIFSEYLHNVNIYAINTGIFLLPIVIFLQFIAFDFLKIIVYGGIVGIGLLYFIQLLRSFQIIIKKNISIFYMILYLCAFEFAPFLIVYKLLLSLD
ncbi:MAG: DUF4271 domain-containing protein [Bacteroidales bacterium]